MPDLVLYTNPQSRGRLASWMLEEVGAPYEIEILDYDTTMKAPAYLAINPMGKVPAIVHKGVVVSECAAICAYLADAFPEAGLAPEPGAPERGAYYRWLFFAAGPLEAACGNAALGFEAPKERERSVGYGNLGAVVETLDGHFADSRAYVLGDRFTAADVMLGSLIGWFMQFGLIDPRPRFEAYVARLQTRPARIRAEAANDALAGG